MTMARRFLVDSSVTPYYHCISRCVRRAFLCGEGHEDRKQWIEDRLQELVGIFAIEVCAYAVLDNHMHVVLRLNDAVANGWSDEDVVRRWGRLFPPRGKDRQPLEVTDVWVKFQLKNTVWVQETRKRLNSLGWFMKCLKEPLARLANQADNCRGTFWEARFKSIAILDDEALLTTLAYVDLNPLAAGVSSTPEGSPHTSVKARIEHCREQGTLEQVVAHGKSDRPRSASSRRSSARAEQVKGDVRSKAALEDESFWLVPIADVRPQSSVGSGHLAAVQRAGISSCLSLASYLNLLDWSSRLFRPGKARVSPEVAGLLDRLGSSPDLWADRLKRLAGVERLFGTVFATRRSGIDRFAEARGVKKLSNLSGCARQ